LKKKASELKRRILFFLGLVAILVLLDLWSKEYMWALFARRGDTIAVTSWLSWSMKYNTGMAFSLFRDHPFILVMVAGIITPVLTVVALRTSRSSLVLAMWAFVVGGALGNIVDRIRSRWIYEERFHWAVRDFIDVYWGESPSQHWPTFNLADSVICIGVAYLVLHSFVEEKSAGETPRLTDEK
jgi:signal peptidase II